MSGFGMSAVVGRADLPRKSAGFKQRQPELRTTKAYQSAKRSNERTACESDRTAPATRRNGQRFLANSEALKRLRNGNTQRIIWDTSAQPATLLTRADKVVE